jgi:hypothetical protein
MSEPVLRHTHQSRVHRTAAAQDQTLPGVTLAA